MPTGRPGCSCSQPRIKLKHTHPRFIDPEKEQPSAVKTSVSKSWQNDLHGLQHKKELIMNYRTFTGLTLFG
jgi:hypothetical protein